MKNNSKFKNNIILLLVICIGVSAVILAKEVNNLDELWNFNFAKNIAENRLPYKDFNMIQTPLMPIICSLFLRIFGMELIVMRILAIILCSGIIFMVSKILELLRVNKYVNWGLTLEIYLLLFSFFAINYNLGTLLIVLIVLYYEIKNLQKNEEILNFSFKKDIFLGILIGSTILLKQTTGLFISLVFILYKLLIASKKEDFKLLPKIIITRLTGVLIPILFLMAYIFINNIWYEFLDYAIYGIKTFKNHLPYTYLIHNTSFGIAILSIIVPISIIYMYYKSIIRKVETIEEKNSFILFAYSIGMFIFIFPISDENHFLIGSTITIISITYILYNMLKNKIKNEKNILYLKEFLKVVVFLFTIYMGISVIVNFSMSIKKQEYLNHFKYINPIVNVRNIGNFITQKNEENKKVYILDATAAIYMIPIDIYNKNYDMFLAGNFGTSGEEGQIENLEKEENCIVLIMNEKYGRNWQTPEKVINYIINNWNKIGEIEKFDIYER